VLAGLAAGIKLTPLLVIVVFALRRQWRAAGIALLSFAVLVAVLPAVLIGPERTLRLAETVIEKQGSALVVDKVHDLVPGESLKAMSYRLLGTYPFHKHERRIDVSLGWIDEGQALWTFRIAALAVFAWLAWFALRKRNEYLAPIVWGATFCAALLISPETRQAHFLSLALPAAVLTTILAARRLSKRREQVVMSLFGVAFLLAALPGRAIVGKQAAYLLAALCASGFAALLLLIALGVAVAVREDG
jgi:hypothetical protein